MCTNLAQLQLQTHVPFHNTGSISTESCYRFGETGHITDVCNLFVFRKEPSVGMLVKRREASGLTALAREWKMSREFGKCSSYKGFNESVVELCKNSS